MATKKFSELSFIGQLLALLGVLGVTGTSVLSVLIYAGEKKLDEKYYTTERATTFEEEVTVWKSTTRSEIQALSKAVEENSKSVNNLSLNLIDMQISDTHKKIQDLEASGSNQTRLEQDYLREQRRVLAQYQALRDRLFQQMIQNSSN